MDEVSLRRLIEAVATGRTPPEEAVQALRRLPYAELGFARLDHHRMVRQYLPEAVYGPGKSPGQCAKIVVELLGEPGSPVLLTRADRAQVAASQEAAVAAGHGAGAVTATGQLATVGWRPAARRDHQVLVITAGTADLPVADECLATLEALGLPARLLADCGVAGLHRLLASTDELAEADAVVVVAGMEGALASVVGGITPAPVVAVPTSAGYGASLEGVTALLAMLSSCAAGVAVMGIDNGFGAASAVSRFLP